MLKKIIFISFFIFTVSLNFKSYSEEKIEDLEINRQKKEILKNFPVFPKSKVDDLNKKIKIDITTHLNKANFYEVLDFYIKELEKKEWEIVFPKEIELNIWLEALQTNGSNHQNAMIILTNKKYKVNCNLTIGTVIDERKQQKYTITTIYLTNLVLK